MTLLDATGKIVVSAEDEQNETMLFNWLNDEGVAQCVVDNKIRTKYHLVMLLGRIHAASKGEALKMTPEEINCELYAVVSNRNVRRAIAMKVRQDQRDLCAFDDKAPEPNEIADIMADLLKLKNELEPRATSSLVIP